MKQRIYKILCNILRFFSRVYLWRTKPVVIGVTGSVGKTSCRTIVSQVLQRIQDDKIVYTSPKNYNSEIGLIFSIFQIEEYVPSIKNLLKITISIINRSIFEKKSYDILVAEYGIDTPGDMDFLISVMKPDIGIITKLDSVHSDNFPGGTSQLWTDKFKLLLASRKKTYFNFQDIFSKEHEHFLTNNSYIFHKDVKNITLSHDNGMIQQSFLYKKKNISINLIGSESIEYTILALEIAENIDIKLGKTDYIFDFEQQEGRFSLFERNENILIDSSYNAGPESMKQVIGNTQKFAAEVYPNHKIIYILGDMREIGDAVQKSHEDIVEFIKTSHGIFTVGPYMYEYMIPKLKQSGYNEELHSSLSSREIGIKLKKYLKDNSENNYIVLFKGSQNTIFTEEALAPQLKVSQRKNLPRQSEDWKSKKNEFFKSL